jgi:hypothetical protein
MPGRTGFHVKLHVLFVLRNPKPQAKVAGAPADHRFERRSFGHCLRKAEPKAFPAGFEHSLVRRLVQRMASVHDPRAGLVAVHGDQGLVG